MQLIYTIKLYGVSLLARLSLSLLFMIICYLLGIFVSTLYMRFLECVFGIQHREYAVIDMSERSFGGAPFELVTHSQFLREMKDTGFLFLNSNTFSSNYDSGAFDSTLYEQTRYLNTSRISFHVLVINGIFNLVGILVSVFILQITSWKVFAILFFATYLAKQFDTSLEDIIDGFLGRMNNHIHPGDIISRDSDTSLVTRVLSIGLTHSVLYNVTEDVKTVEKILASEGDSNVSYEVVQIDPLYRKSPKSIQCARPSTIEKIIKIRNSHLFKSRLVFYIFDSGKVKRLSSSNKKTLVV